MSSIFTSAASRIASKLFGSTPITGVRSGNKILRQPLAGEQIARYYPEDIGKVAREFFPAFKTGEEARRSLKLEKLKRRGKGPPPKGSGKRSKKKN